MYAARGHERNSIVTTYIKIQQINGDMRIDDEEEDAPMVKLQFYDTWAKDLTDEEKEEVFEGVITKLDEVLTAKYGHATDKDCDRRGAVAATRANNVGG